MAVPPMTGVIELLPQLLAAAQFLAYLAFSWFFGSVAFGGMKRRVRFTIKIVAKLGVGFLCLIAGTSVRRYMFFFEGSIFQMLQLDLFFGGLIAAALVGVGFYAITRREVEDESKIISKLEERVKLLEGFLLKQKAPTLKENEAKKTAESLLAGFSAKKADLKGADWEILLENGKRKAVAVIGAYTGEVKRIDRGTDMLRNPYAIAGIGIIIAVAAFSVLGFSGFPSITEGVASMLGLNEEQFNSLTGSNSLPEECVATVRILMSQGVKIVGGGDTYKSEELEKIVEDATGRQVMLMYKTLYEGNEYIISITIPVGMDTSNISDYEIMQNAEICASTYETLCDCVKIPELNKMPTGFIVAR